MAKEISQEFFVRLKNGTTVTGRHVPEISYEDKLLTCKDKIFKFSGISHIYLSSGIAKWLVRRHPPDTTFFDKAVSGALEFAGRIIHLVKQSLFVMYLDKFSNQVCVFIPDAQGYEVIDLDSPAISFDDNLAESIITNAITREASDIHIKPCESRSVIQFRIDGILRDVNEISTKRHASLISKFKIMANMDIAERRLPQDGGANTIFAGRSVDLRFSTTPTINGESLVIRVLDPGTGLKSLSEIGFYPEDEQRIRKTLAKRSGLILVTGPTGSGKSTTLYAAMDCIRGFKLNTISIEDPVEYRISDIKQIEVNEKIGNTFGKSLRHVLRHDPDVILIGEIRDHDTAKIAVQSALTGHLVISTLHTRNSAYSISRLLEMGVEAYQVRDTVQAVLAQRLVRKYCPACGGKGRCEVCDNLGFKGRTAIYEWLEFDHELKELIKPDFPVNEFMNLARAKGMRTMKEHAQRVVADGVTNADEIFVG